MHTKLKWCSYSENKQMFTKSADYITINNVYQITMSSFKSGDMHTTLQHHTCTAN